MPTIPPPCPRLFEWRAFASTARALALCAVVFALIASRGLAAKAYVLWSPPAGQNAQVKVVDTTAATLAASIPLPLTTRVLIGSILNAGNRVYISARDSIHEIDPNSNTLVRTITLAGRNSLDKMMLDPSDPSRMLVLEYSRAIWQVNLNSGTWSQLVATPNAATFTIRPGPGVNRIFVCPWGSPDRIGEYSLSTGAPTATPTAVALRGVQNMDFLDRDTLIMHGYGVGKYNLSSGSPVPIYQFNDGDGGWGYDWMITSDGTAAVQPGWTQSRVRLTSDGSVVATNFPATNFYYGSAAAGDDGTFIMSGGDLNGYNSMGVGKLRIGRQSDLLFTAELDLGNGWVVARGFPYRVSSGPPPDTTPPVLTLPANQVLEASGPNGAVATFAATATDDSGGAVALTYSHTPGTVFPMGTTTVTVTATDTANNSTSSSFNIEVRDTTAPVISSLKPSVSTLWPANHKMVAVTISAVATDLLGLDSVRIVEVSSSEPANGRGDGDSQIDVQITGDLTLNLRAERSGGGNGRTYTIVVAATDRSGNVTTGKTSVSVPKSQGGK